MDGSTLGAAIALMKKNKPTDEQIESAVSDWLEENITNPDSPPLDRSLSASSAAAPADIVGNLKNELHLRAVALDALVKKMLYIDPTIYSNEYKDFCSAYNVPWIDPEPHSTKDEWIDGASYQLETIDDEYYQASNGAIQSYTGWSRTDYVSCNGASSITFPPVPQQYGTIVNSGAWFDQNKDFVANLTLSKTETVTKNVPTNAYYFGISSETQPIKDCILLGIVPHE